MEFSTMTGYIEPFHSCLMAARFDFMSEYIKTGSFIYLNLPNGQTVKAKDGKKEHLMRTDGNKPYHCDSQKTKNNLKIHQHIQSSDKPNVCKTCRKDFKLKNGLKTHQRVHTGEKPFVCDTCDRGFRQKGHLKRHQRVHTKRTPDKRTPSNREIVPTSGFLLSRYCLDVQKAT